MRFTLGIITPKAKPVSPSVVPTPSVQSPTPPVPTPAPAPVQPEATTTEGKTRAPWGSKKVQSETLKLTAETQPSEVSDTHEDKVVDDKVDGG